MILANTIWGPLFFYFYDAGYVAGAIAAGLLAEFGVLRLYLRDVMSMVRLVGILLLANVTSFFAGGILIGFLIGEVRKSSFVDTMSALGYSYALTIFFEYLVFRPFLPTKGYLLFRAVLMANLVNYAILFIVFFLWYFEPGFITEVWRDVLN